MNAMMNKQTYLFQSLRSLFLVGTCLLTAGSLSAEEEKGHQQEAVSESELMEAKATSSPTEEVLKEDQPAALSVAELKKKVIKLNRDLFILEEDLLFPANTQFVVYLSLDTGKFFQPDSISLKVDDELVAAHLYTERQVKALARGGMQRLHMGNLKSGEHEVTAIIVGQGPDQRDYTQAATLVFDKGSDISSLEVRVKDNSQNYQPSVQIVEWD